MGSPSVSVLASIVLVALLASLYWRWRSRGGGRRRGPDSAEARERRERLRLRLRELAVAVPARAPLMPQDLPALAAAATIEAHLLAGEPHAALAAAEAAVAETPAHAGAHVLLARALLYCDALVPASAEVARARALGGRELLLEYVEGRVDHLLWIRRMNPGNPEVQQALVPPLVTPFDRFVLKLARQQQVAPADAAVWLAGAEGGPGAGSGSTLDAETIATLVTEHREAGLRSLELLVAAAERSPGSAELVYHAARRALQTGFVGEGRVLMERLEPLMATAPDREAYERDRADLEGRVDLPPEPVMPPTPEGAKRSSRLRILP
jgi:hypothetical protein